MTVYEKEVLAEIAKDSQRTQRERGKDEIFGSV